MSFSRTIIVTYNSLKWIDKCLGSCEVSDTIVIDNSSTDSTVDHIREHYPEVTLMENKSNIGFGQANNIGIQKALSEGAEYVFLLNQDAYLDGDCIDNLIKVHKDNPDYGILSPIHLNGIGTDLDHNFSEYLRNIFSDKLLFDLLTGNTKQVYSLTFVNAAGWLIPKSTIDRVGLFDPMFFQYGEDENYCQRVRYHGLKIGVVPAASIRHDRENMIRPDKTRKFDENALERQIKLYLGDVNLEPDYKIKKRIWLNNFLRAAITFNYQNASTEFKRYRLLCRIIPEIEESRFLNKNNFD